MRRATLFLSIALFLLVQPAVAFLFGRSELIEPLPIVAPTSLAIVNATTRQAVILSSALVGAGFYLTLTSTFLSITKDYMYLTRSVTGAENTTTPLLDSNIFLSGDQLYALMEGIGFVNISLQSSSLISSVAMPCLEHFIQGWQLGTHADGQNFPLISRVLAFDWILSNGTIASLQVADLAAYTLLSGNQLYFLTAPIHQGYVNAIHIDLDDSTVRTGASYLVENATGLILAGDCRITLNASAIVFLVATRKTIAANDFFVLTLDPATLTFTSAPLVANISDLAAFRALQCGPTAVPGQYLAWDLGAPALDFYLIDLNAGVIVPYQMQGPLNRWLGVAFTPQGDFVASNCGDTSTECAMRWELAFDPAHPSGLTDWVVTPPVVAFGLGVQTNEQYAVIETDNSLYNGLSFGFLVLALAPVPHVVASIGMEALFTINDHFAVDPVTQTIYVTEGIIIASESMYSIDWRNPTPETLAQRLPLPNALADTNPYLIELVVRDNLVLALSVPFGTDECTLFQLTVSPYNFTGSVAAGFGVNELYAGPNNTVLFTDELGLREWDAASLTLLRTWPYNINSLNTDWTTVATVLANGTLYSIQWDIWENDNNTLSCFSVQLGAPNTTLSLFIHTLPYIEFPLLVSAEAVVVNGFLYVGIWFTRSAMILKYSLSCTFLSVFDTQVPYLAAYEPVISVGDLMYFARTPDLLPVYLDCGQGAYRNLSTGVCSACPNGSVNAQADTQACMPCPTRTQPDVAMTLCVCGAGFYSTANDANCDACPEGGVCLGSNELIPAPGYWRAENSSSVFYACPFSTNACNGSDVCSTAYLGPLCAVCAPKHALVAGLCRRCSSFLASVGFWLLAGLVYLAIFLVLLIPGGLAAVSVLKSFISFAQIVSFPAKGPLPQLLANRFAYLARFLSLANFQVLSIVSPDCLLQRHLNFATTAVAEALLPMCFLLLILFITLVPWHRAFDKCFFRCKSSRSHSSEPFDETPGFADRFEAYKRTGTPLRVMLFIVLLATPSVTQQLASFFTCKEVASLSYLVHDYTVQCYHGLWTVFVAPVSLLLCLYAVGVPAALFTLLYRYRDTLDLRFLHSSYKDDYYWWDITEQLRKLSLLLVNAVLAPRAPSYYGPTALAICFVSIAAHMQVQPYKNARDMWFQTADLAGVTLYFLWSVSADSAEDTTAWLYWLFAVGYTLASMGVMLWPLLVKLAACVRRCCGRSDSSAETENELDPLMPRLK